MTDIAREVFARLDAMGIEYERIEHPAVHTISECIETDALLRSVTVKNYFLTTKNRKRFFLCLMRPEARFRSADISKQAGSSRLSFAGEEDLMAHLRVRPGAVSPMGLLFEEARDVELLVDRELTRMERLAFHPCDNTCTLAMRGEDFLNRFLPELGRVPRFVDVHDALS